MRKTTVRFRYGAAVLYRIVRISLHFVQWYQGWGATLSTTNQVTDSLPQSPYFPGLHVFCGIRNSTHHRSQVEGPFILLRPLTWIHFHPTKLDTRS